MAANEKQKKSRLRYMISALVIAIAIWSLISYSNDPDISKTFHNIKVSYIGEAQLKNNGFVVLHEEEIPDLSARLSGKRGDLIQSIGNVRLEIDVSDITEAGEYELTGTLVVPNNRLSVEKQNFSTVSVAVDEYESKEIPLELRKTGTSEYMVVSETERNTITIHGAKSELVDIKSAFAAIDDGAVRESGDVNMPLMLAGADGESIKKPPTVDMEESIVVTNTLYDVKEIPVRARLSDALAGSAELDADAAEINPGTVSVGVLPNTEVSELTAVITEITDGEIECELEPVPGVIIPEDLKRVKVKAVYKSGDGGQ